MPESQSESNRGKQSPIAGFPLKLAAVIGSACYLVGYGLVGVLAEIDDGITRDQQFEQVEGSVLDGLGFAFYNAHRVDIETAVTRDGSTNLESLNLLAEGPTQLPELLYYSVPVAVLLFGGYLLARVEQPVDRAGGLKTGATIVVGYLPLTIAGAVLFELSGEQTIFGETFSFTASPELVPAVGLMGIVYPLVFGGIGGLLYSQHVDSNV